MKVIYYKQIYVCDLQMSKQEFISFKEIHPNYETLIRKLGSVKKAKVKELSFYSNNGNDLNPPL